MPKPVAVIANGLQQKQILGGGGERRSVSQQILQSQANTGSTPLIGKPVRLVAVENITLSGTQTVDGVSSIDDGTRILAAGQSTQSENGVYLYNASGAWPRASDTIRAGTTFEILEGTDYANRQAVCTNNTDPVIGTDNITFLVRNPVGGSGTAGKLPFWTDTLVLGDSVIEQDSGNIGIGMTPTVELDVNGTVRATGLTVDIASAETGRVLTALDSSGAAVWSDLPGDIVTGTGTAAYVALWTDTDAIANSVIEENAGNIGIDMTPVEKLDVNGTVRSTGLTVDIASAEGGRVLTVLDSSGAAVWSDLPDAEGGVTGTGTAGYVAKFTGTDEIGNSALYEDGSARIGLGTTSPNARLEVKVTTNAYAGFFNRNVNAATDPVLFVHNQHSGSSGDAIVGYMSGSGAGVRGIAATNGSGVAGSFTSDYNARALYVKREYNTAASLSMALFHQDAAADTQDAVEIQQDGSGDGLSVTSAGIGVNVATTTGIYAGYFTRNVTTGSSAVLYALQDHASNNGPAVYGENHGSGDGVKGVTATGVAGNFTPTGDGYALYASRNVAATTKPVAYILQDHTTDTQHALSIKNDGSGDSVRVDDGGTIWWKLLDGQCMQNDGGVRVGWVTKTANYTLTKSDYGVTMDSTGAARTVTLPAASDGANMYIIHRNGGSNVTIARDGTDTINNAAGNITIAADEDVYLVVRQSTTNWICKKLG